MNVLVIDIDSLRPDHVGCYGYEKETTPNIDSLAEDAVVFENAYAASSPSLPSRASFISGRYSVSHGVVSHGPEAERLESPKVMPPEELKDWDGDMRDWMTLPELFFENRVKTAAVSSEPRHPASWINQEWHEFYQPQEPEGEMETHGTVRGEEVADLAVDFLERQQEDFFLYVQFWDPHIPCKRSDEEIERFIDGLPSYLDAEELEFGDGWNSPHVLDIESSGDVERIIAGYDAEIRYADRQVGRLVEKLKQQGIYDETVIVLVGDHGEEFGENGVYREHWSVYEGTQRIPMIVKPLEEVDDERKDELVTNIDIAPTLADYAGLEKPDKWQGSSLKPLVEDKAREWRDFVVVDHGLYTVQRAIITSDGWKLVKTLHPGARDIPGEQLFNLDSDRYDQNDVSAEETGRVEELEERMADWVENNCTLDRDPLERLSEKGPVAYRYFKD